MSASDRFSELRQRVEQGESNIKAAASEDSAKLEAKADEARKAADEHAAQFAVMAQERPGRPNLTGTSCRAAGISTSSTSDSASRRRRPSTMPRALNATPSGPRVTPSTPSTSLW
jgi:hypothetical protein